jgi:hypothetical protein
VIAELATRQSTKTIDGQPVNGGDSAEVEVPTSVLDLSIRHRNKALELAGDKTT